MNRKQRRAAQKSKKKTGEKPNKEIDNVMGMFDLLPDECSACLAPYNKKDRKMVTSWNVVVREKENIVRLYCPQCWIMAKNIIQDIREKDAK